MAGDKEPSNTTNDRDGTTMDLRSIQRYGEQPMAPHNS